MADIPEPPDVPLAMANKDDGVVYDGEMYVVKEVNPDTKIYTLIRVKIKDSDPQGAIIPVGPANAAATLVKIAAPGQGPAILAFPIPPS
jgi:hypothetical protein